jgi:monoamine oxidase
MDALYGKVWSADLDKLGIHEIAEEEDCAELGYEVNLQSTESFRKLIQYLSSGVEVRTQWPVKEINYSASVTQLRSASNYSDFVLAHRVVVAVPAPVLKDGDIRFVPELPEPKRDAIKQLGFGNALKVVLKFNRRFMPENMQLIVCSDSTFTQLWTDGGAARNTPNIHTVTAFVSGDAADTVSKMDDKQKVLAFLQQLDQMFGSPTDSQPATKCYLDALIYDWSKQPFIRGAYSYPALGSKGCRSKVARVRNFSF